MRTIVTNVLVVDKDDIDKVYPAEYNRMVREHDIVISADGDVIKNRYGKNTVEPAVSVEQALKDVLKAMKVSVSGPLKSQGYVLTGPEITQLSSDINTLVLNTVLKRI